jgi:hypothetical protein
MQELQQHRVTFGWHAASPTTSAKRATSGLHPTSGLLLVCGSSANADERIGHVRKYQHRSNDPVPIGTGPCCKQTKYS